MIKTVDTDEADPLVSPEEGKHGQAKRTSRTIIIEPVIFIYSAFALVTIPIGEQFVYDRIAQTYGLDPEEVRANKSQSNGCQFENTSDHMYILQQKIQHDSSEWLLYLGVAAAVPGVVSTILLGTYSDLAGRKAAILAPNIGGLLKVLSFLAVSYFNLPVQYMLLGFLLDGVSGSQMSMWMSGFAYIADVTSETERSFRVTLLEASIGFGAATSQIGVGYWIQASGYNYPFWFLAGLALLNISYIIIFVPETIRRIPGQKLCTIENYTQIFRLFAKDDGSGRKWKLRLLMLIAFPIALVMTSSADVQALFMLNSPLCFDSVLIGFFRAGCVLSMQIGSLIGVKVLGRWLSDIWLCFIGSLFSTAYCLLNAFAVTPFLMYAGRLPLRGPTP